MQLPAFRGHDLTSIPNCQHQPLFPAAPVICLLLLLALGTTSGSSAKNAGCSVQSGTEFSTFFLLCRWKARQWNVKKWILIHFARTYNQEESRRKHRQKHRVSCIVGFEDHFNIVNHIHELSCDEWHQWLSHDFWWSSEISEHISMSTISVHKLLTCYTSNIDEG